MCDYSKFSKRKCERGNDDHSRPPPPHHTTGKDFGKRSSSVDILTYKLPLSLT